MSNPIGRPKGSVWTEDQKVDRSILWKKLISEGRIKVPTTLGKKLKISFFGKLRLKYANRSESWTPELRERLRQAHKGKPKFKLRGSNHYLWKGGITPINQAIRNSLEYKTWRESIFKRDDWACVQCGDRSRPEHRVMLQADHIKSFSKHPDLRFVLSNGRTLCLPCHKQTDTYGVKAMAA